MKAKYVVLINGFYLARFNLVRPYQYDLTNSIELARKFSTPLELKYLGKFTDYLDSISREYEVQVWKFKSTESGESK